MRIICWALNGSSWINSDHDLVLGSLSNREFLGCRPDGPAFCPLFLLPFWLCPRELPTNPGETFLLVKDFGVGEPSSKGGEADPMNTELSLLYFRPPTIQSVSSRAHFPPCRGGGGPGGPGGNGPRSGGRTQA